MIYLTLGLVVWQNVYNVDNVTTRGTSVLLLRADTVIVSGAYGSNFRYTFIAKIDPNGDVVYVRRTSADRGGLVPGAYLINTNNDVVIVGEGYIDSQRDNEDITVLRVNTDNNNFNTTNNLIIGRGGNAYNEIGKKITYYKDSIFFIGYEINYPGGNGIGIAKIEISNSDMRYLNSNTYSIGTTQEFGSLALGNSKLLLAGNDINSSYLYLIDPESYAVLNRLKLSNVRVRDIKYYNDRFYITGSYNDDVLFLKVDDNLNVLSACYFQPAISDDLDEGIRIFLHNEKTVIIGNTRNPVDGYDTFVIETDTLCSSILRQTKYGYVGSDEVIYDAYKGSNSLVAVGESNLNSSHKSLYVIGFEGNSYVSCSEKPVLFNKFNLSFPSNTFSYNTLSLIDKTPSNFEFNNSNVSVIGKDIICTPLSDSEGMLSWIKFSPSKGGLSVEGNGVVDIRTVDGRPLLKKQINGKEFIKLKRGIYLVNGKKVTIY